jgi:hypothetical protein
MQSFYDPKFYIHYTSFLPSYAAKKVPELALLLRTDQAPIDYGAATYWWATESQPIYLSSDHVQYLIL